MKVLELILLEKIKCSFGFILLSLFQGTIPIKRFSRYLYMMEYFTYDPSVLFSFNSPRHWIWLSIPLIHGYDWLYRRTFHKYYYRWGSSVNPWARNFVLNNGPISNVFQNIEERRSQEISSLRKTKENGVSEIKEGYFTMLIVWVRKIFSVNNFIQKFNYDWCEINPLYQDYRYMFFTNTSKKEIKVFTKVLIWCFLSVKLGEQLISLRWWVIITSLIIDDQNDLKYFTNLISLVIMAVINEFFCLFWAYLRYSQYLNKRINVNGFEGFKIVSKIDFESKVFDKLKGLGINPYNIEDIYIIALSHFRLFKADDKLFESLMELVT
ncbi:hypothetical protein WICMUC_003512 [Wickerhamomyces mucosus]|uniref:Uncharacterized protein n=1 Tax=Wickerhamomyces mucosus TaxID=1378264 RepID=A0A9P8TC45_9ASCO|nr:hypothetical protein WICMUC_003512 [Wickerhamomyces mucosus]